MEKTITFIGLDVHKKSLSVAVADGGVGGEVRFAGTISNTAGALTKLADRLARKGGVLSFCYEAGPCGYGVYRHLPGTDGACGSGFGKKARIEPPCVSHGIAPISPQAARPLAAAFRSGLTSAQTCQSQRRARRKALVCRCRRSFPKAPAPCRSRASQTAVPQHLPRPPCAICKAWECLTYGLKIRVTILAA